MVDREVSPSLLTRFTTFADTSRIRLVPNPFRAPRPTTKIRAAGILPKVGSTNVSLNFPLTSPDAMRCEIAPPMALSTAPVAPPGFVIPSKRFTTTTSSFHAAMSPTATRTSIRLPRGANRRRIYQGSRGSLDPIHPSDEPEEHENGDQHRRDVPDGLGQPQGDHHEDRDQDRPHQPHLELEGPRHCHPPRRAGG